MDRFLNGIVSMVTPYYFNEKTYINICVFLNHTINKAFMTSLKIFPLIYLIVRGLSVSRKARPLIDSLVSLKALVYQQL